VNIRLEDIEFCWKDEGSDTGYCPALYKAPKGYIVQGKILDEETKLILRDLAADETAVFVPANVLDRLKEAALPK